MKTIFFPLLALFFLIGFDKNQPDTSEYSLEGAWELISFYSYDNNEIIDTVPTTDGYRQIKMYSNGKVMWTRYVPKDSVEWFGYGSYAATPDTLVETLEYGSASMMKVIATMRVFVFKLELSEDHFTQITFDENGNYIFSENYNRIK